MKKTLFCTRRPKSISNKAIRPLHLSEIECGTALPNFQLPQFTVPDAERCFGSLVFYLFKTRKPTLAARTIFHCNAINQKLAARFQ